MSSIRRRINIAVVGIGNTLLGDEGLGVAAVRRLNLWWSNVPEVECLDGGTMGIQLLPFIEDANYVLLLDALKIDAAPTQIREYSERAIKRSASGAFSAHDISVPDMVGLLRIRAGERLRQTRLIGMVPQTLDPSAELSYPVQQSLPNMCARADTWIRHWLQREVC